MSTDEQPEQNQQPNFDTLKKQLEVEKLNKEIRQLDLEMNRKWYRKPQWIAALSPIFLGTLTITIAFATGLIQNQSTLNKIQEENFNARKQVIVDSITQLRRLSDSLKFRVARLNFEKKELDSMVHEVTKVKDTLFTKYTNTSSRLAYINQKYLAALKEVSIYKTSLFNENYWEKEAQKSHY